jgi:hypothetical protein
MLLKHILEEKEKKKGKSNRNNISWVINQISASVSNSASTSPGSLEERWSSVKVYYGDLNQQTVQQSFGIFSLALSPSFNFSLFTNTPSPSPLFYFLFLFLF